MRDNAINHSLQSDFSTTKNCQKMQVRSLKESGIEWLGQIPKHWEVKKLKFFGIFFGGLVGKTAKDFTDKKQEGYAQFITFNNICKNLIIDNDSMQYVRTNSEDRQNSVVSGDILFMMSSENREDLGKSAIYLGNQTPFLNSFCKGFRILDKTLMPNFLIWLLQGYGIKKYFGVMGNGFTRINLSQSSLQNLYIALPPLEEQKAIADFLDSKCAKIEEFINQKERSIALLKELKSSLINQAVTKGLDKTTELKASGIEWLGQIPKHWEVIRAGLAFRKMGSGTTPTSNNKEYYDGGENYWVNSGDLNDGYLEDTKNKVTDLALKHFSLKIFDTNSLIMAMYGATIGKVAILNIKACVNQACCVFGESDFFDTKFLFYWLIGNRQNIIDLGSGGGQPNISQEIIRNLKIPLPPLEEQKAIAEYLDKKLAKIDLAIEKTQNQINLIKEYKTSLISESVCGRAKIN